MEKQAGFFDFAAEVGLTKHLGGLESTQKIGELCHINKDSFVLDVGCGVGITPCFLAKKYGCRVVGVDIVEKMVERSSERAVHEGLEKQIELRVADAQNLPFEDNFFDVVITESVTAFPENKQKAVNEYTRVVKPGGYVCLNESTWLKSPVPEELLLWASQEIGTGASPLTTEDWMALLNNAGLKNTDFTIFKINIQEESKSIVKRYGLGELLKSIGRMLKLYLKNPTYRAFIKKVQKEGITPKNLDKYFGYGLYIGKK